MIWILLGMVCARPIKRGIVDDLNDLLGLVLPALDAQPMRSVRVIPVNQVSTTGINQNGLFSSNGINQSGQISSSGINQGGQVSAAGNVANTNQSSALDTDNSDGIAVLPIKAGDVSGIAIIPMRQTRSAAVNKTPVGSGQTNQGESEVKSNSAINPGRFSG